MRTHTRLTQRSAQFGAVLAISAILFAVIGFSAAGSPTAVSGPDVTTLNLDRDGSDIFSAKTIPARGLDITTLYLDRHGADIPEGNWWGKVNVTAVVDASNAGVHPGPDTSTLNLDASGADVATN